MKNLIRLPLFALTCLIIFTCQILAVVKTNPPFAVTIEKTYKTPFGQMEDIRIYLDNSTDPGNPMGSYDFLIEYDPSVLSFSSADPGQLITDCGWEYFIYRTGQSGICGSNACPSGKLRLVAIAEINNGNIHPSCFGETPAANSDLAILHFLVTNDYTMECQFVPIRFVWYDCGDNLISYNSSDNPAYIVQTLAVSREIHEPVFSYNNIANGNTGFPTYTGAQDVCLEPDGTGRPAPIRLIDFINGGIDMECTVIYDEHGDLNLNGLPFEIADFVLFSNYFIYGPAVFTVSQAGQIPASDINRDSQVLQLEDLVFLQRIVTGESQPLVDPFDSTSSNVATFSKRTDPGQGGVEFIDVTTTDTLGAVQLIFAGDITPTSLNSNTAVGYNYADGQTTVLVLVPYGLSLDTSFILQGPIINFTGSGELILARTASYTGVKINANIDFSSDIGNDHSGVLPQHFILHQNYPNPFNNSTVISFELPKSSDVEFEIINLLGQTVFQTERRYSAGSHSISWDGVDQSGSTVGSGVYYYRIVTDGFVESKKMILLK